MRRPNGAFVLVGLVLALLLSAGCAQENVRRISGLSNALAMNPSIGTSPSGVSHDVAITAVDFDPPLNSNLARLLERVSLLAVVENRGNQSAEHVGVQAQLFGVDDDHPLVEAAAVVDRIVPGESRIVQFSELPGLPLTPIYRLTISVRPLTGEVLTGNNTRTYRIELDTAARQ